MHGVPASEKIFDRDGRPVLAARLGDIPVLVETGRGAVHRLNPAAAMVWDAFAAGEPEPTAVDVLVAAFGIPRRQAEEDARALLGDWTARGWQWKERPPKTPRSTRKRRCPEVLPPLAGLDCVGYALAGRTFRICYPASSEEPLRALLAAWQEDGVVDAPCFHLITDGDEGTTLLRDQEILLRKGTRTEARGLLLYALACHLHGTERFAALLHAAAVSDGRHAVILAAPSGSGKSTLSAALLGEGLCYCGDDYLPIRAGDCQVLPFPTALNLKEGSWSLFRSRYPQLEQLDTHGSPECRTRYLPCPETPAQRGYPACALVFPNYQPGAGLHVTELAPPVALLRLSEAGAWLGPTPLDPADLRSFLGWMSTLPAHALTYGDAEGAVRWIKGLFP